MDLTSLLKKTVISLAEWIVFFSILFILAILNLIFLVNIITVDMPWEEPVPLGSSFATSLSIVIVISFIITLLLKFSKSTFTFKQFKGKFLAILFVLNSISCVLCLSRSYRFNFFHQDGFHLLIIALISAAFSIQIFMKDKNFGSKYEKAR